MGSLKTFALASAMALGASAAAAADLPDAPPPPPQAPATPHPPRNRLGRAAGGAPWGEAPKALRGGQPCTAAETISPIAMHMAPTTMASAVFFFSMISAHRS